MPLAQILADFGLAAAQCDSLIANAHKTDAAGVAFLPPIDQQQITVAAFLNLYVAWETFLESSLSDLMIGGATISGSLPVKYVNPINVDTARTMLIGVQRFFDYGNHDFVRKMVSIYFQNGYPYEPHLSAVNSDLADLRTMRNASAHISSTTQTALESLAQRLFAGPRPNIDLYSLLMANDPSSPGGDTVYLTYKNKLMVIAELIAQG